MENFIIAIIHEHYSNGALIGKLVAEKLGVACYDKDKLSMMIDKRGLSLETSEIIEEKKTSSFLYSLFSASEVRPLNDELFIAKAEVIRNIAKRGDNCVIVGSCCDYVLENNPNVKRVFIHSAFENRLNKASSEIKEKSERLESFLKKKDKQRIDYYNHFTFNKWGDMKNYDLCIDSGKLGIEKSAEVILQLAK